MRPTSVLRSASRLHPDEYLRQARDTMARRRPKAIFDVLSPMPSRLLNASLAGHIPDHCHPGGTFAEDLDAHVGQHSQRLDGGSMPVGHHLVHFPLQTPGRRLAPDGADPDHAPGAPFVRRLWAGGSVSFAPGWDRRLRLDGRRAVCVEEVGPPSFLGGGDDKVVVEVVRRYGPVLSREGAGANAATPSAVESVKEHPDVEEVRRLVFLKEGEQAGQGGAKTEGQPRKILKAPAEPEATFTLVPDARLLFHFSALTFNAHAIHLDPCFAREHEGHRGILVHGPLSLVLMLSLLRSHLAAGSGGPWSIDRIDYRNVAPLVAGEPMKVCLRSAADAGREGDDEKKKWQVWVEGPEGRLAVRGTAVARLGE